MIHINNNITFPLALGRMLEKLSKMILNGTLVMLFGMMVMKLTGILE